MSRQEIVFRLELLARLVRDDGETAADIAEAADAIHDLEETCD